MDIISEKHAYVPALQLQPTNKDANQLLPIFLRMHILPSVVESQRGALLRVLFLWRRSVSIGSTEVACAVTALLALAILEAAVLECKKRDVDTPEVKAALDFLEPYVRPQWLIPQYRDHVLDHARTNEVDLEGQQQVLRATFPGIRDGVRELLGVRADALARKFHETHDMKVKE